MSEPSAEMPAMADYGVGAGDWTPLPWSWAADHLVPARNYWLVSVDATGRPHALPVWGVWDDTQHRFYFSCSPSSRKARNLAANPNCVVAPEDTVECVSIEGTATPVTDPGRLDGWVDRYLEKYLPMSPTLDGEFLRAHASFEVVPSRGFGVIERDQEFSERATRWTFE